MNRAEMTLAQLTKLLLAQAQEIDEMERRRASASTICRRVWQARETAAILMARYEVHMGD